MKNWIKKLPYVKRFYDNYREIDYKQKFATTGYGSFWGVFETFDRAIESAPKTKSIGYDNAELAQEYRRMLEQNNWENSHLIIRSYDYPILFWLKSIFSEDCRNVVDFGGNIGIHYYTYSQYLKYPKNVKWTICEVPEIAKVGTELAAQRGADKLFFTSDLDSFNDRDILIASGSVQYVEDIALTIARCERQPKHLLINRLPLYDGERFVTLQNGGNVFYPQFIFNKAEFIQSIEKIGYEAIDIWEDRHDSCYIPFHQDRSLGFYTGLYARLKNTF